MTHPEFRSALKESGLKPISCIQQLFPDHIRLYREKGIYWAAPGGEKKRDTEPETEKKEPAVADRQKLFFELAFANIQKRLTDAGLDRSAADEIADVCMHSYHETEPRKTIHNLLCQRYGNKIGARYYRKAIKYTGMV